MLKLLGSCGQCILLEHLAVVRQFGYNCSVFFKCDENMWHPYVHSALRAGCALGLTLVVVNRPEVNYTDVLLNRLSAPVKWKPEILKGHDNISVWMIHRVNCFKPFPGQKPSYLTYFIHYSHSFEWCNKTEIAFCEWQTDSLWLSIKLVRVMLLIMFIKMFYCVVLSQFPAGGRGEHHYVSQTNQRRAGCTVWAVLKRGNATLMRLCWCL